MTISISEHGEKCDRFWMGSEMSESKEKQREKQSEQSSRMCSMPDPCQPSPFQCFDGNWYRE